MVQNSRAPKNLSPEGKNERSVNISLASNQPHWWGRASHHVNLTITVNPIVADSGCVVCFPGASLLHPAPSHGGFCQSRLTEDSLTARLELDQWQRPFGCFFFFFTVN